MGRISRARSLLRAARDSGRLSLACPAILLGLCAILPFKEDPAGRDASGQGRVATCSGADASGLPAALPPSAQGPGPAKLPGEGPPAPLPSGPARLPEREPGADGLLNAEACPPGEGARIGSFPGSPRPGGPPADGEPVALAAGIARPSPPAQGAAYPCRARVEPPALEAPLGARSPRGPPSRAALD